MATYVGVDFGATSVRAAVGDRTGRVDGRARTDTPSAPTSDAVVSAVRDTVRSACTEAGVRPETVAAAGIGAAGPLDPEAGAVRPTNLDVESVPLVGPLSRLLETERVRLHNDATAGVIGERAVADAPADTVYLTVSTGIGAGVAVDGHVCSGWDGNAAEVGHFVLDPGGLPCGCGATGCWEAYCSGRNVPTYARHLHDGEATVLPMDETLDAEAVFDAAPDDEFAARVVEQVGRWNARGVATLVHAYAPRLVSVGGAVALGNPDAVLAPIRARLPDLVTTNVPTVRATTLGDDAVLRGALASAVEGEPGR
jgi:glucokinase